MGGSVERPTWIDLIDRYGWAVVVAAGLFAYSNCFEGQLFHDDLVLIQNLGARLAAPGALVPHPLSPRWLGEWSFVVGGAAFGTGVAALHTVNLAVHLLAAVVLWALVGRTLRLPRFAGRFADRAGLLATAAAGLWAVHPLNTQAVTYLIQRFEAQMGLFVLVSVWAALRAATAGAGRFGWYALSVAAAYAATATKEPALVLPFVLFVYDRLFLAGSWREAVRKRWAFYLCVLAVQAVVVPAVWAGSSAGEALAPPSERLILSGPQGLYRNDPESVVAGFSTTGLTPWTYLRSQSGVILHYVRLAAVPAPLVLDYNWPVATQWWQIWPQGLAVLALLGATGWAVARGAAGGVLGVWFFAFLAVTSSFVPINDLAVEHRMYLPLVAVVAAVVLVGDRGIGWVAARFGWREWALKAGAVVAVGAVLTALTVRRNEDYLDPFRMYQTMIAAAPDNARTWNNLGYEYARQGKIREASEAFQEATRHPRAAPYINQQAWQNLLASLQETRQTEKLVAALSEFVTADPENPSRRFLLAHARFEARDLAGAVADYRAAIELADRSGFPLREARVFGYYGQALSDSGNQEAAAVAFRRALEIQPELPLVHIQLGQVLARLGRYAEAEGHFQTASTQAPQRPEGPYNLGVLRMYQGTPAEAAPAFQEALRRDRKYIAASLGAAHALHDSGRPVEAEREFAAASRLAPDWAQRMVERSWRMSTHGDVRARYAAEGLRLARQVVAAVGERDPGALDVLAAALAETGRFEEAERIAARAVEVARSAKHAPLANEIEQRRLLYARGQPYRQPAPVGP